MEVFKNNQFKVDLINNDNKSTKTLSIITRHIETRKQLFQNQLESLKLQMDKDYEQWILTDFEKKGTLHANRMFERCKPHIELNGKYVFILDDDAIVINPTFIKKLKLKIEKNPDIIFIKGIINGCTYPLLWEQAPRYCHIDMFNFIVRKDIYYHNLNIFSQPPNLMKEHHGGADFKFIDKVYSITKNHIWWDESIAAAQQIGGPR